MEAPMSQKNRLYPILGIAGLGAWLLFILACSGWPSWSPDGTRVLAPYSDPVAQQTGIALYDLRTRAARSLFSQPAEDQKDSNPAYAQWENDGQRAIVITTTQDSFQVTLLPVDSLQPARNFVLGNREGDLPILPFPQLGKVLYIGGKRLSALNLETGAQVDQPLKNKEEAYLSTDGSRILYVRQLESGEYEFGAVDPADLGLHPLFQVSSAQLEARGLPGAELYPLVAPEPHGSRLAARVKGKTSDAVAILGPSGLEALLLPDFGVPGARIGLPQWAPGGKLLYLPVAAKTQPKQGQYFVAEVPIEGGPVRMTKIAPFHALADWDDGFSLTLQLSLSPDGATLATTTATLSERMLDAEAGRALYLVDLRDPARSVTSIPAPLAPSAAAAKETE
jgi:WD40-like Beta Propeller Repeat